MCLFNPPPCHRQAVENVAAEERSVQRRRAFMKKLETVESSRPSCWEMVICISLEGRRFSLKMATRHVFDRVRFFFFIKNRSLAYQMCDRCATDVFGNKDIIFVVKLLLCVSRVNCPWC
ncbi:hypothetical protein EYF80_011606 [Liparis tanakae]|uniref:Uncharacterized protein n=1 Tax=Liparis tanakae TaxID=230148 RepID=A0A4Z2IK10_9TELE|nr:hypothetical protein EYF80_011606 [Liparis tanakae]